MSDNTFKQNTFVLKEDGKIVFVPEVPNRQNFCGTDYNILKRRYDLALQSEIANGVEVSNQNEIDFFLVSKYNELEKNKPYTLNCRVEIREEMYMTNPPKPTGWKVAHVTFPEDKPEQPEKKEGWPVIGTFEYDFEKGTEKYTSHVQPEAAGQQTASLQKQVEELREEIKSREAVSQIDKKRIAQLEEALNAWNEAMEAAEKALVKAEMSNKITRKRNEA